MNIVISPYSQKMRNGKQNPKNYPYWQELIDRLVADGHTIDQVGVGDEKVFNGIRNSLFNLSLSVLEKRMRMGYELFLSVDNFFPHMLNTLNIPVNVIVVFSKSDPLIYGYKKFTNILKDRRYLRPDQFGIWEQCEYQEEAFVSVEELYNLILKEMNPN